MKRKLLLSMALLALLTISVTAQTSINGKWKLVSIANNSNLGADVTLNIDRNRIGGNGGCNTYGGSFWRQATKVKFSQVFSTKMWCDNGNIENEYFGTLEKITSFKVKNGQLFLLDAKKKTILIFKRNK